MAKKLNAQKRKPSTRRSPRRTQVRKNHRNSMDWNSAWQVIRPMLVVSMLLVVSFGGLRSYQWLMKPTTLPIRHVQVVGDTSNVDSVLLQSRIKTYVSGGFFSMDLETVMSKIKEIPWVYQVSLRRMWPDRLLISIEAQQPIARWGADNLLNRYGEVFSSTGGSFVATALPKLSGERGRETDLILFFNQADQLLHPLELKMVELREDARGDQRLILDNGIELALGRKNRLQRLNRFASAYEKTLQPFMERIAVLDLRYANGFAVRWNRETEQYANLEKSVGSRKSTQSIDAPGISEKSLITNQVTTSFSDSPCTPMACASFPRPTDFSRVKASFNRI